MTKTIVGLFDDFKTAEQVVRALVDRGFRREDISLIAQDATHGNQPPMQEERRSGGESATEGAAAGAGTGAVLGGLAGLLVGLGALAIPGVGPIIAAGPIAAALAGAGVGAVAGGVIGALVDAGVPEEQAKAYAEGVRRGGTLVALKAPDEMAEQARDIMNRFQPIDISDRARLWREEGQNIQSYSATGMAEDRTEYSRDLAEHGTGRQDWSTHDRDVAGSGTPALTESELQGRSMGGSDTARFDQGTTGTGTTRRSEDSERRVDPMERGSGGTGQSHSLATGQGGQGHELEGQERDLTGVGHGDWETRDVEGIVASDTGQTPDRLAPAGHAGGQGYSTFADDFRNHYDLVFASRGHNYEYYEPAYHYGYDLAGIDRYRGRRWSEIEPEARRDWEQHHPGSAWDEFKDGVRHAWERVTAGASSERDLGQGTAGDTAWRRPEDYGTEPGQGHYPDVDRP